MIRPLEYCGGVGEKEPNTVDIREQRFVDPAKESHESLAQARRHIEEALRLFDHGRYGIRGCRMKRAR